MILTREAIANINEFYRLADEADRAYMENRTSDEVTLRQQAWEVRNKITALELHAYLQADLYPPHIAGRENHDAQVAVYYSTLGRCQRRTTPAINPQGDK
ncbi:hypothetical protein [Nocardia flavorosea]|uniref:Uncharacterized protein n=1 Tax=Nocardia flavorosea TaxID=53429 RepID=A0A846YLB5_9NOCA|nr:hypothetical protein [Nocardia flavorosea]NKY60436.1 hypothetical protein [Nocardia flavorosea]